MDRSRTVGRMQAANTYLHPSRQNSSLVPSQGFLFLQGVVFSSLLFSLSVVVFCSGSVVGL